MLGVVLITVLLAAMSGGSSLGTVDSTPLMAERVGRAMFGPYVLVVELAAFVLLAALVVAAHLGRDDRDIAERKRAAAARVFEATQATLSQPIVTELKDATVFWPAEGYHQRYLQKGGQSAEKNAPEKVRCYG